MDFLGIGPFEVLLILILAFVLVGPAKMQEIARTLGRTVRAIKKASVDLNTAFTKELDIAKNELASSPQKETKTEGAPLTASKPTLPSQVDQPTKSGGASATQ